MHKSMTMIIVVAAALLSTLGGCATLEASVRVSVGPQSRGGYQQQRAPRSGGQYRPQSRGYQQRAEDGRCRKQPDGRWVRMVPGEHGRMVPDECPPPQGRR